MLPKPTSIFASIVTLLLLPVLPGAATFPWPFGDGLVSADAVCVVFFFRVELFNSLISFIVLFQAIFIQSVQFPTNGTAKSGTSPPVSHQSKRRSRVNRE